MPKRNRAQRIDKLANEISKLEARGGDVPRRRALNPQWCALASVCPLLFQTDQSSIINADGPLDASHSLNLDQRRRQLGIAMGKKLARPPRALIPTAQQKG